MGATEKKYVLMVAALGSFLAPFMSYSVNVALPSIGNDLQMDAISLSWTTTSYLLASAIFLVPLGRVADIYGRKRIFIYGVLLYTASSLLSALSNSTEQFICFRVLQGIGGAMIFSTIPAILTSVFPVGERGRALGLNVASVYLGFSIGPILGGLLTQSFGWRSIFLMSLPVGLTITAFTLWKLKEEWAGAEGERLDLVGSIIYSVALVAIMYGLSLLPAASGLWLIMIGSVSLLAFVKWEVREGSPILNVGLFRSNVTFALSNLAALLSYSATFAVTFILSLYLQYIKGFTPQHAGLILASRPVMQAVFSPVAGKLSDRVEPRVIVSVGMALTATALFSLTFLNEDSTLCFIVACLILLGFGFSFFSSPNTNAIMSSVEKKFYGVASGTLATMRLIGMMLSMGVLTLVFAVYIGRTQITFENYAAFLESIKSAFTIFVVLCSLGILASLARGNLHRSSRSGSSGPKPSS
ncbi:MAG: MFS transporter [Candidatus Freyarchaeota archaeon]